MPTDPEFPVGSKKKRQPSGVGKPARKAVPAPTPAENILETPRAMEITRMAQQFLVGCKAGLPDDVLARQAARIQDLAHQVLLQRRPIQKGAKR
jgi:hypothetical protein